MPANDRCRHGRQICSECVIISDAAKRAYDIIRAYVTFVEYDERIRSWVALKLEDGSSDGTLYLSKGDAARHQADERRCAYFSYRGAPNGFASVRDAAIWLDFHRAAYDAGIPFVDPDEPGGGPEPIMPTPLELLMGQRGRLIGGRLN